MSPLQDWYTTAPIPTAANYDLSRSLPARSDSSNLYCTGKSSILGSTNNPNSGHTLTTQCIQPTTIESIKESQILKRETLIGAPVCVAIIISVTIGVVVILVIVFFANAWLKKRREEKKNGGGVIEMRTEETTSSGLDLSSSVKNEISVEATQLLVSAPSSENGSSGKDSQEMQMPPINAANQNETTVVSILSPKRYHRQTKAPALVIMANVPTTAESSQPITRKVRFASTDLTYQPSIAEVMNSQFQRHLYSQRPKSIGTSVVRPKNMGMGFEKQNCFGTSDRTSLPSYRNFSV